MSFSGQIGRKVADLDSGGNLDLGDQLRPVVEFEAEGPAHGRVHVVEGGDAGQLQNFGIRQVGLQAANTSFGTRPPS